MQNQDQTSNSDDRSLDVADIDALAAELPAGPGIHLMSRGDLEAAIGGASGGGGDWEDGGATSREEAVRLRELLRLRDDPDLLWRRHLVADDGTLGRLRGLMRGASNMVPALDIVRRAAVISRHSATPMRLPPLVLVGPPGTGKSRIAGMIAGALRTSSRTINCTSLQDLGPLLGYNPAWRGAGQGAIAKALLACPTTAPVLVIDEAEKVALSCGDGRDNPLDVLLPLLEPTTAAAFRDNYLDVPMRCENIVWVFCANSLTGLSAPLLDRSVVVHVEELSGADRIRALEELVADTVLDHGVAPADLDAESLAVLDGVGLRRARALVCSALADAIEAGRDWPNGADFRAAAAMLGDAERRPSQRRQAGFIHF